DAHGKADRLCAIIRVRAIGAEAGHQRIRLKARESLVAGGDAGAAARADTIVPRDHETATDRRHRSINVAVGRQRTAFAARVFSWCMRRAHHGAARRSEATTRSAFA